MKVCQQWVYGYFIQLSTDSVELSDGESTEISLTESEGPDPEEKDGSETESDNNEATGNVNPTAADKRFMAEVSFVSQFLSWIN